MKRYVKFSVLEGKTLTSIKRSQYEGGDCLIFKTDAGHIYLMYHEQDCCEGVNLEDIVGDLDDLLNTPIFKAIETSNRENTEWVSETYTFYHLTTKNGTVTLRWHGSSNGYYSESVNLYKITEKDLKENLCAY